MAILTAIDRDPGCKGVVETAYDLATSMEMELVLLHVVPEDGDEGKARAEIDRVARGRGPPHHAGTGAP